MTLKTHNILDYVGGVLLMLIPSIFNFAGIGMAQNIFVGGGIVLILYSLLTNYQYAIFRVIPLGVHMTFDVLLGIVVMVAPWAFDYRGLLTPLQEFMHYIVGLGVVGLVAFTRTKTESEKVFGKLPYESKRAV